MRKMIILDRDGVINRDSDDYIKSTDEWIPITGSLEAINRLKKAGYLVTVATNQSGIARGLFEQEVLQQIHDKMHRLLAIRGASVDGIFYCPHGPKENCACRKPKPGLVLRAAENHNLELDRIILVGDKDSDRACAKAAGCHFILASAESTLRDIVEGILP